MKWPTRLSRLLTPPKSVSNRLKQLAGFGPTPIEVRPKPGRRPITHVVILDGTMSSLESGKETNAGRTYRLLSEMAPNKAVSLHYEAGIQWQGLRRAMDVMAGVGINRQIRQAYGSIASRYKPGDKIFLIGYSRGAYAVRSLAGVIDQIGLVRVDCATHRMVRQAYRHYRNGPNTEPAKAFRKLHCHTETPIEMIGVWDTVRALGFRAPLLWRFSPEHHKFHNHELGDTVRHGFHALALNETRNVFAPVLWTSRPDYPGTMEQMWFGGTHGDIGGQLSGHENARHLSNIPLTWMLDKAEGCGLPLPDDWREGLSCDGEAKSVGSWQGFGKLFLNRRRRTVGTDPSEQVHPSVSAQRARKLPPHLQPQAPNRPRLRALGPAFRPSQG